MGIYLYLEVIFRLLLNIPIFSMTFLYVLIFGIVFSCLGDLLGRFFNICINKIMFLVLLFGLGFLYSLNYSINTMFGLFFSFNLLSATDQVVSFAGDGLQLIIKNTIPILLLFLPFILFMVEKDKVRITKDSAKHRIIKGGILLLSVILFFGLLNVNKDDNNSPYELFYKRNNTELNVTTFGVVNSFLMDGVKWLNNFTEDIKITVSNNISSSNSAYQYNNWDIDFAKLINDEDNEDIKKMHLYFQNEEGTKQNEYTNYFKGKNLILFMAESFNEIAVSKELTPTLYKLVNSGFVFDNYYTPTISSTIGGEFQELTSLVAASGFLKPWKEGKNTFPMGIATSFTNLGYSTFAYHDNSYTFQSRYKYLEALGFTNFKACKNGLEEKIKCNIWPQSDVEMIKATVDDYVKTGTPFFTYYATVSGHGGYSFKENAMARKNKEYVEKLSYSEGVLAYLAAQKELDLALEYLINYLDEVGILQDTVIALVGDHYPYYLSTDEVNEVASYEKDDVVEINHSNFILWNSEMSPIHVDKVGSQIDVLPTLYNLFGVNYDSRLLIGKDILSNSLGLAIFGNRSWVSDYGTYFAQSKKFVLKDGKNVDNNYVDTMNTIVNNKVAMSKNIMIYDYYRKVLGEE